MEQNLAFPNIYRGEYILHVNNVNLIKARRTMHLCSIWYHHYKRHKKRELR